MASKITLPPMGWQPKVDPTPGHLPIVANGYRKDTSYFSDDDYFKMKEAGFNIAQRGTGVSTTNFKTSLTNAAKYGVKLFARIGFENPKLTGFPTSSPSNEQIAILNTVLPTNSKWSASYGYWSQIADFMATPQIVTVNGTSVDVRKYCAGFYIADEPLITSYWGLSRYAHMIWDKVNGKLPDNTPPFFMVNFLPNLISGTTSNGTKPTYSADNLYRFSGGLNNASNWVIGYTPIESYEDYIDLGISMFNIPLLSFDSYPFQVFYEESDWKTQAKNQMIQFFASLIFFQQKRLTSGLDFWSHILAVELTRKNALSSGVKPTTGIPTPGKLRFSAFISLLYGARGLSYWTLFPYRASSEDFVCTASAITETGVSTDLYFSIKGVNSQIAAVESIFLSTKIAMTAVSKTPPHVDKLTEIPGILHTTTNFGVFSKIETSGKGVVMAHLYNSQYNYIAMVSMDYEGSQTVSLTPHTNSTLQLIYDGGSRLLTNPISISSKYSATFGAGDLKIFRYPR